MLLYINAVLFAPPSLYMGGETKEPRGLGNTQGHTTKMGVEPGRQRGRSGMAEKQAGHSQKLLASSWCSCYSSWEAFLRWTTKAVACAVLIGSQGSPLPVSFSVNTLKEQKISLSCSLEMSVGKWNSFLKVKSLGHEGLRFVPS